MTSPSVTTYLIPCDKLPGRDGYCALPVGARILWRQAGEFTSPDTVLDQEYLRQDCAASCALDLSEPERDSSGVPLRLDALPWIQQLLKDPTCTRECAVLRIVSPRDACFQAAAEVRRAIKIAEEARRRVVACFAPKEGGVEQPTQGLQLPTLARLLLDLEQQAQALEVIARDGGPA